MVINQVPAMKYKGDAKAVVFPVPFPYLDAENVSVQTRDIGIVYPEFFTVNPDGVNFFTAPAPGDVVFISRHTPIGRQHDFSVSVSARTLNAEFDRPVMVVQEQGELFGRALMVDVFLKHFIEGSVEDFFINALQPENKLAIVRANAQSAHDYRWECEDLSISIFNHRDNDYTPAPFPPVADPFDPVPGVAVPDDVPAGTVIFTAAPVAEIPGFLPCDGRYYDINTQYKKLYAVIGKTWNRIAYQTLFAVPDFRGEFIRGSRPTATLTSTTTHIYWFESVNIRQLYKKSEHNTFVLTALGVTEEIGDIDLSSDVFCNSQIAAKIQDAIRAANSAWSGIEVFCVGEMFRLAVPGEDPDNISVVRGGTSSYVTDLGSLIGWSEPAGSWSPPLWKPPVTGIYGRVGDIQQDALCDTAGNVPYTYNSDIDGDAFRSFPQANEALDADSHVYGYRISFDASRGNGIYRSTETHVIPGNHAFHFFIKY